MTFFSSRPFHEIKKNIQALKQTFTRFYLNPFLKHSPPKAIEKSIVFIYD